VGPPSQRQIAIANLKDGRAQIERRLDAPTPADLTGLVAAPDGSKLYYIQAGGVWQVAVAGGKPALLCPGEGVAVHPNGRELIVQTFEQEGVGLKRYPLGGGKAEAISVPGSGEKLRLAGDPIGGNAVREENGRTRILVAAGERGSWYWQTAILDPDAGTLTPIRLKEFDGDIFPANWTGDGQVLGVAYSLKCDLWRFQPRP
jgi:hypothetical protein